MMSKMDERQIRQGGNSHAPVVINIQWVICGLQIFNFQFERQFVRLGDAASLRVGKMIHENSPQQGSTEEKSRILLVPLGGPEPVLKFLLKSRHLFNRRFFGCDPSDFVLQAACLRLWAGVGIKAQELFRALCQELSSKIVARLKVGITAGRAPSAGSEVQANETDRIWRKRLTAKRTCWLEAWGCFFDDSRGATGTENMAWEGWARRREKFKNIPQGMEWGRHWGAYSSAQTSQAEPDLRVSIAPWRRGAGRRGVKLTITLIYSNHSSHVIYFVHTQETRCKGLVLSYGTIVFFYH